MSQLTKFFEEIDLITDMAEVLLGDRHKATAWMMSSNKDLGGTPRCLVIAGDTALVLEHLTKRIESVAQELISLP